MGATTKTVEESLAWATSIPVDKSIPPLGHIYPSSSEVSYCGHQGGNPHRSIYEGRPRRWCAECRRLCEADGWNVP